MIARKTSEPLTSLVKQLDAKMAQNKAFKSYVVFLTDDADKTADELKAIAQKSGLKNLPLCLVESPSGPPAYQIAQDAEVTVMMWNRHKVKANHAFGKGKMTEADVKAVVADFSKVLSK